jgi:hypothetical protein
MTSKGCFASLRDQYNVLLGFGKVTYQVAKPNLGRVLRGPRFEASHADGASSCSFWALLVL